jgi:hypothetical protein
MKTKDLTRSWGASIGNSGTLVGDTPGVVYRSENKGFARQWICKWMKIKKIKIDVGREVGKGICKSMKTKGGEKCSGQWTASSDDPGPRCGGFGQGSGGA